MNRYTFGTWVRITKHEARKLWGKVDIHLCPSNLCPGPPWYPDMLVNAEDIQKELNDDNEYVRERVSFDHVVGQFKQYNCVSYETGQYISYYKEIK